MLKHGFSRNIIETIVRDNNLRPRKSLGSFIKKMKRLDIPIWVLSSGVGDIIQRFFEEYYDIDNLKIHSNFLDYDKHGIAIAFNADKCVYNHTKKESLFKRDDFKREKEKRPYQIVLGDSVDDVKVVEDHTKSLTIGFVDDDINNRVKIFRKHFDLILCNCQPMDFINDYLVEDVI